MATQLQRQIEQLKLRIPIKQRQMQTIRLTPEAAICLKLTVRPDCLTIALPSIQDLSAGDYNAHMAPTHHHMTISSDMFA